MPKTKWLPNTLAPFHLGLYEVKTSDGKVAGVLFKEGGWDMEAPFEQWRGLNCSLAKKKLEKLKRVMNASKEARTPLCQTICRVFF